MPSPRLFLGTLLTLTMLPLGLAAHAQAADTNSPDCSQLTTHAERTDCATMHAQTKTIYLQNISSQNDANEIMVAIRNSFDPGLRLYLVANQNALVVSTYPQEMAKIETLVHTLDRPHKAYRLAYTLTELDGGKTIGTEHLSMVVVEGQRTSIKEGDKVPVATGSYATENATSQTQFTYLDVGMNIDSSLTEHEGGAILKAKVEQSSLGAPSTIAGIQEPVVRQTVFDGIATLILDKPVMLGSIDVPNSTHHFDIAVVLQAIK